MRRAALAIQQFQTSAGTAGAAVAAISFGAFTTAAVLATRESNAFEKAIAEIATLLPGATLEVERLSTNVRRLAKEFGISVHQQAAAAYQIISAGARNAAEANFILEKSNTLAVGGLTQIAVAADGLTSILNAYGPSAVNAAQATDAMFVAMKYGKTTIDELSRSVGLVAPIAAEAGVSLDELLSAVSALTKGGIRTRLAFTGMRQIISSIIKPTTEARYAAEQLGIEFNALSLYEKGLVGFFDMLKEGTGGSTESLAMLFGGVEALVPILALVGRQSENFAMILEEQASKAGAAAEALKTMEQTGAFAFDRLKTASTDVLLDFGNQVRTLLIPAARALTNVLDNASTGAAALRGAIYTLGGVITLLALTWLPLIFKVAVPAYVRSMLAATIATGSFSAAISLLGAKLIAVMATPMGAYIVALGIVLGILAKITIQNYKLEKELQRTQELTNEFVNNLAKLDYSVNALQTHGYLTALQSHWEGIVKAHRDGINAIDAELVGLKEKQEELKAELRAKAASRAYIDYQDKTLLNIHNRINELMEERARLVAADVQDSVRLTAVNENLANLNAQLTLAEIQDTATRAVLRLEEQRQIEQLARERARLEQQLADWLLKLTATNVDKQLGELDRLQTGWVDAFGVIDDVARESFDRILDAITMEGALEDIQRAAKDIGRIDMRLAPGVDVVGAYDNIIGHLEVMLSHLQEGTVLFDQINDLIYQMRTQIDRVALDNIVVGPRDDFDRTIRDINNRMQRGIISPNEWTRLASEAHQALVQGLEHSVQTRGLGSYPDEIADEIRKILANTDFLIQAEIMYDDALAEARIALAKGLGDREIYAEAERQAAEAFNRIVLGIIDATDDPGLKRALAMMLKIDTAIDSRNFRKMALEIERAGRAALQMLNAFELISQKTEDILSGMIQIAANLPGAISGDLNSIAQVVGGLAQTLKGLFGESQDDKERRRIISENTRALRQLAEGIKDLSGFQQIEANKIIGTTKALQNLLTTQTATFEGGKAVWKDWPKNFKTFEWMLAQYGVTLEDAIRIAKELDIVLKEGTKSFEQFFNALKEVDMASIFKDVSSQMDLLRRRIELFDLEPFDELDLLRKQFLELTKLDPAMQFALATADLTTSIGRATFIDLLKQIFEQFPDLTFEQLGDLTPQQFLDFIMEMKRVTDSAEEFANNMNALNDSLKNVPDGFKVALARFEATAAIEAKKAADVIRPKVPKIEPPKPEDDIPAIPDSTRRAIRALDAFSSSLESIHVPSEIVIDFREESFIEFNDSLEYATSEVTKFASSISQVQIVIPDIQVPEIQVLPPVIQDIKVDVDSIYSFIDAIEFATITLQSIQVPEIDITSIHDFTSAVDIAAQSLKLIQIPEIQAPDIQAPEIDITSIHDFISAVDIAAQSLKLIQVPDIQVPDIQVPSLYIDLTSILSFNDRLDLASMQLIKFSDMLSRIKVPEIQVPQIHHDRIEVQKAPQITQTLILSVQPGAITVTGVDDPEKAAELALEGLKVKAKSFYGNTTEWYKL